MEIIRVEIPLLHAIGEPFYMGLPENPFEYELTRDFLTENLPSSGTKIMIHSNYHKNMSIGEMEEYITNIQNDIILNKVLKESGEEVARFYKLTSSERGSININIDMNTSSGVKLLGIINDNNVYATFIFNFDKGQVVGIRTLKLCLGRLNGRILFI